ncbi:MAG: nicotinate-nucleotide adenylyltransferase [Planctomycetota bacterium]
MESGGRFGIFGGSFDPLHIGHLVLAEAARERHRLDRVLFMLTPDPPHKTGHRLAPFDARLEMLQAAVASQPGVFEVTTIENDRPGPHYTVETVPLLRAQFAGVAREWFLLIGGDSAGHFARWREARALLRLVRLCVVLRPGHDTRELQEAMRATANDGQPLCTPDEAARVVADVAADTPLIGISSTDVRERVRAGRSVRYLVPDAVREVIARRGLYRA